MGRVAHIPQSDFTMPTIGASHNYCTPARRQGSPIRAEGQAEHPYAVPAESRAQGFGMQRVAHVPQSDIPLDTAAIHIPYCAASGGQYFPKIGS